MNKNIYLTCTVSNTANVLLTLNGFPLHKGPLVKDYAAPSLINDVLVKGQNELSLSIIQDADNPDPDSSFVATIVVKDYSEEDYFTPESGELMPVYLPLDQGETEKDKVFSSEWTMNALVNASEKRYFLQADLDFSSLLLGPSLNVSDQDLFAYGEKLIELMRNADAQGFLKEYMPKLRTIAHLKGIIITDLLPMMSAQIAEISSLKLIEEIKAENIGIRRWCNDRIYEIFIKPNFNLIVTNEGTDGNVTLPVYVSLINGELKIVR
jgi:hypothetical protein